MIKATQRTVRNSGLLILQNALQIVAGILFVIWIPRLMGAQDFGRYSLLSSLAIWFVFFSTLGFKQIMSRFVPELVKEKNETLLMEFFGRILTVRLIAGLVFSSLYLIITMVWLQDLPPQLLVFLAGALLFRVLSNPLYLLFLGLNRADRWGLGDLIRRWLSLIFMIPGFLIWGLNGACLAVCLTEMILFFIGMIWIKLTVIRPVFRLDIKLLKPYLKFGLVFYFSTIFLSAFWYSGDSMVKIFTSTYTQVGYFGLGRNIYFALSLIMSQLTVGFVPLLVHMKLESQNREISKWVGNLITVLTIGAVYVVYGILFLGDDLVTRILGTEFSSMTHQFLPFALTLVVTAVSSVYFTLTMVFDKSRISLQAAVIQLLVFWGLGPWLVMEMQGLGAAYSILIASFLYGLFFVLRLRRFVGFPFIKWSKLIILSAVFIPLIFFRDKVFINTILFVISSAGYMVLLFLFRSLRFSEMRSLLKALLMKGAGPVEV
jgi:O-antigen/teichoic acid export membrane protein